VLTPVPLANDFDWWRIHSRYAVFGGSPFRYKIGPLIYRVPQLSIDDYLIFEQLTDTHSAQRFIRQRSEPDNRWALLLRPKHLKKVWEKWVPAAAIVGLVSEFFVFMTTVKKKLVAINPNGAVNRETAAQSMNSPNSAVRESWEFDLMQAGL
jgi:hypothetical protein